MAFNSTDGEAFPDPLPHPQPADLFASNIAELYAMERYIERSSDVPKIPSDLLYFMQRAGYRDDAPVFRRNTSSVTAAADNAQSSMELGFEPGYRKLGRALLRTLEGNKVACALLCVITSRIGTLTVQGAAASQGPKITVVDPDRF